LECLEIKYSKCLKFLFEPKHFIMKIKNYILLILISFLPQIFFSQTIPNGGFENWTTKVVMENPILLENTNVTSVICDENSNVTRVAGVTGDAVRLETIEACDDLLPGVIGNLGIIFEDIDATPISATPDSISLFVRHDIPDGDTATVFFLFLKDGQANGFVNIPIEGSQSTFEKITVNVPPVFGVPDSLRFYATSGSFDNPMAGGFLEIDDIELIGISEQISNNDFETWEAIETTDPDDWTSFNDFQSIFGFQPMVTESSDAFSGNSSIRIETVQTIDFDEGVSDTLGFALIGDRFDDVPGFAIDAIPTNLSLFYKYESTVNDSASIIFQFYKYNASLGYSEIESEFLFYLPPADSWTSRNFEFGNVGNPDSARIILVPFDLENVDEFIPLGNVLHVDDLSFDIIFSTKNPIVKDALKVFPNPATDQFFINTENVEGEIKSFEITDLAGRIIGEGLVENYFPENNLLKINSSYMQTGMYFYKIQTDEFTYSGKVMIQK